MSEDERDKKLKGVGLKAEIIETSLEHKGESPTGFGICDHCENFTCSENEFGDVVLDCDFLGRQINRIVSRDKPMKYCTKFWDKRFMKIRELKAMAWLIEANPNEPIGFIKPSYNRKRSYYDD